MLERITRFFTEKRQRAHATDTAIRHFESTTGGRAHRSSTAVLHSDEFAVVVRVCHGRQKPHCRTWLRISGTPAEIHELTFDEVTQYGEKHWL